MKELGVVEWTNETSRVKELGVVEWTNETAE